MRTDIAKFSGDTLNEMGKRMGRSADAYRGVLKIEGISITTADGSRSTVQNWMEIIFAEKAEIVTNSNGLECLNVEFTNGDTTSTFVPYWFKG